MEKQFLNKSPEPKEAAGKDQKISESCGWRQRMYKLCTVCKLERATCPQAMKNPSKCFFPK